MVEGKQRRDADPELDLEMPLKSTMDSSHEDEQSLKPPPLLPMSNFERCMRNKAFYDEDVGVPPIVINGWFELERPVTAQAVQQTVAEYLPRYRRLRAVGLADGSWVEQTSMDWGYHVVTLPKFNSPREQEDFINKMVNEELDMNKPLWRIYIMELSNGAGGCLLRHHHSMGDGIAANGLLQEMGGFKQAMEQKYGVSMRSKQKPPFLQKNYFLIFLDVMYSFIRTFMATLRPWETDCAFTNPRRKQKWAGKSVNEVVFFPSIPLQDIKNIKNSFHCTINDVLYSASAGMIRRYCQSKGDDMDRSTVRSLLAFSFPRNVQGRDKTDRYMNNFAMVPCQFPTANTNAVDRLRASQAVMSDIKNSAMAFATLCLVKLISAVPGFVRRALALDIYKKHCCVFSNVPGPPEPIEMFGQRVTCACAGFGNFVHQIIFNSYDDKILGTIAIDPQVINDGRLLGQCLLDEIQELKEASGKRSGFNMSDVN